MYNKVNRNYKRGNPMQKTESEILNKIIQILITEYGYYPEQIRNQYAFNTEDGSYQMDAVITDIHNPENIMAVIEIKKGPLILPLAQSQLREYMILTNARYGILYNGYEKMCFEAYGEGDSIMLHQIPRFPKKSQVDKTDDLDIKESKKLYPFSTLKYKLSTIESLLRTSGQDLKKILPGLLVMKIWDERTKSFNFEKLSGEYSADYGIISDITSKISENYRDCTVHIESLRKNNGQLLDDLLLEFKGYSLIRSDFAQISTELIRAFEKSRDVYIYPEILFSFIFKLVKLKPRENTFLPYCGSGSIISIIKFLREKYESNADFQSHLAKDIVGIESNSDSNIIVKSILSILSTSVNIVKTDLQDFENYHTFFDFVISVPPFGNVMQEKELHKKDNNLGDFTSQFIKKMNKFLKIHGTLCIILPNRFLFDESSRMISARREITNNFVIKGIFQLPNGIISNTKIGMALIILGKRDHRVNENYSVFMSEIPGDISKKNNLNEDILNEVVTNYERFLQSHSIVKQNSLSFITPIEVLSEQRWTITDKIPEIKLFPESSTVVKLADVAEIISAPKIPLNHNEGEQLAYIRIGDLTDGKISSDGIKIIQIPRLELEKLSKFFVKTDDILLSIQGTIGKLAIVANMDKNMYPSPQLLVIRAKSHKILPKFLYQTLTSNTFQEQLARNTSGQFISRISHKLVGDLKIPILSNNQQQELVNEISELEKKISNLKTRLEFLKTKVMGGHNVNEQK